MVVLNMDGKILIIILDLSLLKIQNLYSNSV